MNHQEHQPKSSEEKTCVECNGEKWFQQRLYQLLIVTGFVLLVSYFTPVLRDPLPLKYSIKQKPLETAMCF